MQCKEFVGVISEEPAAGAAVQVSAYLEPRPPPFVANKSRDRRYIHAKSEEIAAAIRDMAGRWRSAAL